VDSSPNKPPTTFQDQLALLTQRHVTVKDPRFALSILMNLNYYRFTGYLLPFKTPDNTYLAGTSFERVVQIYEFDRKLRNLLIGMLESVEIRLRTQISYYFAHKYGGLGYLEPAYFRNERVHQKFLESIQSALKDAHKHRELFAVHHFEKYQGHFPIWVAVEVMSFGTLSKFYMNMHGPDRSAIAKGVYKIPHQYLGSWLECLVYVRNMCAHYTRLYDKELKIKPLLFSDSDLNNDRLFAAAFICKRLFEPITEWNNTFLLNLQSLIDQYQEDVDISRLGFPQNWLSILKR